VHTETETPTKQPKRQKGASKNPPTVVVEKASFTPKEFRERNGNMSRGHFARLEKEGLGPRTMKTSGVKGGLKLISREADADWIRACEERSAAETEAEIKAAEDAALTPAE